jgi:signal transduction histidine kinase
VTRERYAYWAPLIEDQGRATSLTITSEPGVLARCAAEDLASALDALIENAVAHTADGTAVRVGVTSLPGGWTQVDVGDQGGGVPLHALQRGRSDRGSSGLGLDIARSCAESTGGSLVLAKDGEWSVVRLVLGPAVI